jgi:uncharacterized protein (TIGR02246 family)
LTAVVGHGEIRGMLPEGDALAARLADRMMINDLVNRYAAAVDRREPETAAALFAEDGELVAYAGPDDAEPMSRRNGRAAIAEGIDNVRRYRATSHTIASHVVRLDGDRAEGETRCVAHHVLGGPEAERLLVWYFRYLDAYARAEGRWWFARREIRIDFIEERPLRLP